MMIDLRFRLFDCFGLHIALQKQEKIIRDQKRIFHISTAVFEVDVHYIRLGVDVLEEAKGDLIEFGRSSIENNERRADKKRTIKNNDNDDIIKTTTTMALIYPTLS